jgi:ABC-type transport system substrate-binding protein
MDVRKYSVRMIFRNRLILVRNLLLLFLVLLISPRDVSSAPNTSVLKVICHVAMPWVVGNQVVEPLLYIDNDNKFIPCLAESYQMYDQYVDVHLRRNINFQDGTPFDASSVLMNWDAYMRTAKPYFTIDLRMGIKDMEALSTHTVRMWFKEVGLIGLLPVYLRSFYIYSPSYFKHTRGTYPPGNQANLLDPGPWGTGPYMLKTKLDNGETIILEKNSLYWQQDRPIIETIIMYGAGKFDSVAAHRLIKEGKVDLFDAVSPSMLPVISKSKSATVIVKKPTSFLSSLFNMRKPHSSLLDIRVRKALNLLIDRRTLFKYLARGSARMTPFILPRLDDEGSLQPYPYSPEEAKALLKAAGFGDGHPLSITISYFSDQKKMAHAIAGMLKEGGVRARLEEYETRIDWYQHVMEYTHGPSRPMESETWDLNIVFTPLYTNSVATYFGESFNSKGGYRWIPVDIKADDMFFKAMRHRDQKASEKSLRKLEKYLFNKYYMMPIYINPTILAVHNRISDNSFSASGYLLNLKEIGFDKKRQ